MAKPLYILCAKSTSIDTETNRVSVFHVIEKTHGKPITAENQAEASAQFQMKIIAAWASDPDDIGKRFDYRLSIIPSGASEEETIMSNSFVFNSEIHRFIGRIFGAPFEGPGLFHAISAIRRVGDSDWKTQKYSFPVVVDDGEIERIQDVSGLREE